MMMKNFWKKIEKKPSLFRYENRKLEKMSKKKHCPNNDSKIFNIYRYIEQTNACHMSCHIYPVFFIHVKNNDNPLMCVCVIRKLTSKANMKKGNFFFLSFKMNPFLFFDFNNKQTNNLLSIDVKSTLVFHFLVFCWIEFFFLTRKMVNKNDNKKKSR